MVGNNLTSRSQLFPSLLITQKAIPEGSKNAFKLAVYATTLKRARQMGSLTGFVSGTSQMNNSLTQGNLRVYEQIIG